MIPLGVLGSAHVPAGGGPLTATFVSNAENGSGLSTYTFSSMSFGTASANRRITVAVAWRVGGTSTTVTAVTIGGVSATIHLTHTNDSGGNRSAITWATAAVPSGSTGNVVVTFSGTIARCGVTAWALNAAPTVNSHASTTTNGFAINIGNAGSVILAAAFASGNATNLATWTGATERHESLIGVQSHSAADSSGASSVAVTYSFGWVASSVASAVDLS